MRHRIDSELSCRPVRSLIGTLAAVALLGFSPLGLTGCSPAAQYIAQYMGLATVPTGTSITLIVRDGASNDLVDGALVQISGPSNRQASTNASGMVSFSGIEPGVYTIRAWQGRRYAEDRINVSGGVSALMYVR